MNDFGVWTKMTPRPGSDGRSFVFINDGRRKKEKGGKKKRKRERAEGGRAPLMCFIVEGDRS